ncbi:unnamed protein product, partial [marine sediment metagenome]
MGCRDGTLTAELAGAGNFLVHGLDKDPAMVQKARRSLRVRGLNGRVAIEEASWRGPLPYPDNTVNLLVVDDLPGLLTDGLAVREILRVLAPNGVACVGQRPAATARALPPAEFKALLAKAGLKGFEMVPSMGAWAKVKKRPDPRTDEWTHFLHNPGRNFVSNDAVVGPEGAKQLRWLNGPYYFNAPPGLISAGGLVFTGHMEWKPGGKFVQWILLARDAYNGCLIWRRPVDYYNPEAMVADGERLYLPLAGK